jgi:hypothetical protein
MAAPAGDLAGAFLFGQIMKRFYQQRGGEWECWKQKFRCEDEITRKVNIRIMASN